MRKRENLIVTDEESIYSYSFNDCSFSFDDGERMSGDSLRHTVFFDQGKTHYIKCKDEYDNVAGNCNIVVKGGLIG